MNRFITILKQFDWLMFAAVVLLVCLGLVMIYSITFQKEGSTMIQKQAIALGLGIFFIFVLSFIDYRVFKNYAWFLYTLSILLLIAVLFFGTTIRGMRGWFDFGFLQFQPSEFAKVALLIVLAQYFAGLIGKPSQFRFILVSGILTLLPCGLIALQPDLGSALILVAIWLGMLLFTGIKRIYVLLLTLVGGIVAWLGWAFALQNFQKERILAFFSPTRDPLGTGYSMIQSKIAVGSGQFLGRGLGQGPQSQLRFLPEQHSDFIFAVTSEELGFVGALILLALFCFLMLRMIKCASRARDDFGLMIVLGAVIVFSFQILINIGMNVGILPIAGVPLPLISYGGSALLFSLIILGLIQSIWIRSKGIAWE